VPGGYEPSKQKARRTEESRRERAARSSGVGEPDAGAAPGAEDGILATVTPFIAAGAGFLLAVLWFDLMFDVQVARHRGEAIPEAALSSIAGYYRRVTTAARPMNRLVAAAMLGTLGSIIAQIARADRPRWLGWASLVLAAVPIVVAAVHTVPSAVRLGSRADPVLRQGALARSILREHVVCLLAIAALLVIQLSFG
jgi:hypothetical protein